MPAFEAALLLIGSVVAIELVTGFDCPALVEDFDLELNRIHLRLQSDYRCLIPENRFRLVKSPYMILESPSYSLEEEWKREIDEEGQLGKRIGWSGPMMGVGANVLRRKVSNRKK